MKKTTKTLALILAICLLVWGFAGCSTPQQESQSPATSQSSDQSVEPEQGDKKLKIGLTNAGLTMPFFVDLEEGAKAYVESLGYEFIAANSDFDPTKQCADIEDFVTMGVDGILVVGCDQAAIDANIDEAVNSGIPCVQIDMRQQTKSPLCFVGSDNYEGGKLLGEYALKYINENFSADEEVVIGVITRVEASIQLDRVDGFKDAFKDAKNVKFLDSQDAYEAEEGMNVAENIIEANPDIDFIYATAVNTVTGAYAAIESSANDHVKLFGFDMSEEAAVGLQDGTIIGMAEQMPKTIGETAAKALIDNLLTGAKPENYDVLTECMIYDKSNVAEYAVK